MSTNEKEDEQWNQEEIIGTRTTNHSTNNLNKLSCSSVRVTFICEFTCLDCSRIHLMHQWIKLNWHARAGNHKEQKSDCLVYLTPLFVVWKATPIQTTSKCGLNEMQLKSDFWATLILMFWTCPFFTSVAQMFFWIKSRQLILFNRKSPHTHFIHIKDKHILPRSTQQNIY